MFWSQEIDGGLVLLCSFTTRFPQRGPEISNNTRLENPEVHEVANEIVI